MTGQDNTFNKHFEAYLEGTLEEDLQEDFEIELFSSYVDQELEPDTAAAFESHLETDEKARAEFEKYQETVAAVRELGMKRAPNDFLQDVTTTINTQSRGSFFNDSWFFGFRIPFEAFIAIMLVVMGVLYFYLSSMQSDDRSGELREVDLAENQSATRLPPDMANVPKLERHGQSMGALSGSITLTVDAESDLKEIAQNLREQGFHVRPQVTSAGHALLIDVPVEQAERFLDAIRKHHQQPAMSPQRLFKTKSQRAVTVRLLVSSEL